MTTNIAPTPMTKSIRIAIPVADGRLHGHFGGCREFAVIQVDPDQKLTLHADILPAPEHQPGAFPRWLREQGVTVVIAGGIGKRALANFAHHGITVRAGISDASVEQLVALYLNGQLTLTPEGCEHHGHQHDHEHGHHHHEHGHHHQHAEGQP
jgi:ATP-binding protein involved in chromosome partitioning